jgi:anti-sigma B factor antagonist
MAQFTTSEEQGILIIDLSEKRATVETAKEFKADFLNLIENGNTKKIIVDFSKVEFVDSSFLGAIVSGLKKITALKGDIKILGLQPPVRAMFELTRLYKVFEIFDNKTDAIGSF